MKELFLLRHAKAVPGDASMNDFDRPLAPKGKKDARVMGDVILALDRVPEQIVTSPAARALATARLFAAPIERWAPLPIREEPAIYDASPGDLLAIVRALPPDLDRVMIVGHNMGLEQFAEFLIDPDSSGLRSVHLPTCGLALFCLACDRWEEARPSCGVLDDLLTP